MGGSITPGQAVLECLRKQAEQAPGSEPVSSAPPRPLFQFLPQISALASLDGELQPVRQINPPRTPGAVFPYLVSFEVESLYIAPEQAGLELIKIHQVTFGLPQQQSKL